MQQTHTPPLSALLLLSIALFVSISFFPLSVHSRQGGKTYYKESLDFFSKGQDCFNDTKLKEAYESYSQAILSAERSLDFEPHHSQRYSELKNVIRNAKNQKGRIRNRLKSFQVLIKERKIARGMTSEQVIASWGKPQTIEKTLVKWAEYQKWIYGNILLDNDKYVFFKNDMVIDWEDRTKK